MQMRATLRDSRINCQNSPLKSRQNPIVAPKTQYRSLLCIPSLHKQETLLNFQDRNCGDEKMGERYG